MSSVISQLSCFSSIKRRFLFHTHLHPCSTLPRKVPIFNFFFCILFTYLFISLFSRNLLNPSTCFELLIYICFVIEKLVFFIGCLLYCCLFGDKRKEFEEIPEKKRKEIWWILMWGYTNLVKELIFSWFAMKVEYGYSCLFGDERKEFDEVPEKKRRNLMNFLCGVMLIWLKELIFLVKIWSFMVCNEGWVWLFLFG